MEELMPTCQDVLTLKDLLFPWSCDLPSWVTTFDAVMFVFQPILSGWQSNYCETNTFMRCRLVSDVKGDTTGGVGVGLLRDLFNTSGSHWASLVDDFGVEKDSICTNSAQLPALDTQKHH